MLKSYFFCKIWILLSSLFPRLKIKIRDEVPFETLSLALYASSISLMESSLSLTIWSHVFPSSESMPRSALKLLPLQSIIKCFN